MRMHLIILKKLLVIIIVFTSTVLFYEIFFQNGWSSEVYQAKKDTISFGDYEEIVLDLEARAKAVEISVRSERKNLNKQVAVKIDRLGILIKDIDRSLSDYYQLGKKQREQEIKTISRNIKKLEKEVQYLEQRLL